jgi:hypothetical protein
MRGLLVGGRVPRTYAGRMNRGLLVVLCSLLVAGCLGGGSRAASTDTGGAAKSVVPTPPSDHGGFSGADAKAYDAAYIACYKAAAKIPQTGSDSQAGSDSLTFVRVPAGRAAHIGCRRGTIAVWGAIIPPASTGP